RASARELMSGLVVRRGLGVLGGLALGRSLLGTRCDLGGLGLVSGLGLLRTLTGLRSGLVGVGDELLGGLLRLGTLHGAGDVALALELRPVAGDLEEGGDLLGRLRTDPEPVQRTLGLDLDEGGALGGVGLADLVTYCACGTCAGLGHGISRQMTT